MFPGQPAYLRTPDIRSRYSSEREDVISVRSRRATVVECGPRLGMSGHVWACLGMSGRRAAITANKRDDVWIRDSPSGKYNHSSDEEDSERVVQRPDTNSIRNVLEPLP